MVTKEQQRAYRKTYREKNAEKLREANRLYREKNKEKRRIAARAYAATHREEIRLKNKLLRLKNPAAVLLTQVRYRAKRDGVDFNLEIGDILIPSTCPIFGEPLSSGTGKIHDWSPTVDKIDPKIGYVKGNVWVISNRANRIKNDGTASEHRQIADAIDRALKSS